jgi:hypothetical protein
MPSLEIITNSEDRVELSQCQYDRGEHTNSFAKECFKMLKMVSDADHQTLFI